MSAVAILHKALRAKAGTIEYAGTKDKRAITTQHCTVYRRKPSDFTRVNGYKLYPFIRVGDFELVSEPLKLGDNDANHFDIILREVEASDDLIQSKLTAIRDYGFINYFGLQRFGKGGVHSHVIGKEMFHSNWHKALDMMFVPREGDKEPIVIGKQAYNNGNYKEALAVFPNYLHAERSVLESLIRNPTDVLGAFNKIPKNTRLLCAHAYQSYLWNLAASERIKRYGLECVEGDLVIANDDGDETEFVIHKAAVENHKNVVHVTREDVEARRYSINNVILPLVGTNIKLPMNSIGQVYQDNLQRDSLSLSFFKKCAPEYRMGGAYRRLVLRPKDFQWAVMEYSNPNAELFETEVNLFRPTPTSEDPPVEKQWSKLLRALRVSFILTPGSYATMLLREITRESTETEYHASLTAESLGEPADEDEERLVGSKRPLEINESA